MHGGTGDRSHGTLMIYALKRLQDAHGKGEKPPAGSIAAVDMATADGLASAQHERDTRPDTM